ncbi:Secreted beta-glucosidase sun1 [Phlyctema vagabunda]|uniref:Secreted beta-glucosidase sun1 n=1 Tax=Phlyctema vagabunda TaxID=108571 RepID=A0ABR4PKI0_9HELO
MKFTGIALLSAAGLAAAQHHAHQHVHAAKRASPVEREAAAAVEYAAAVETVGELNGQLMSWTEVEAGIKAGKYVIVGEAIQSVVPSALPTTSAAPSATPTPTPSPSSTSVSISIEAAAFKEIKTSSSSSAEPTSTYVEPTTSSTSEAAPTSTTAAAATTASSSYSSGGSGVNSDFPSGEIDCSTFPSEYGPVALDYLNLDGWISIQQVGDYSSSSTSISSIVAAISGGCTKNSFCSYNCPAGYQKSQWPSAQGSTGQSIGGLYCNSNGKLELSRPDVPQLCVAGVGGVEVKNNLGSVVSVCRTNYPGDEAETVAMEVFGGETQPVCNPDSATYYIWEGSYTTAQYYINPSGYGAKDACQWGEAGSNIGNDAPVNMGVGRSVSGMTFLSLFQNAPTNTNGVLDFDISITGGVSGKCEYKSGKYYSNGVESSSGCTVS